MSNADAIRNLGDDMVQGQERRFAELAELVGRTLAIRRETTELLQSFDKAHSEMSTQLRSELSGWTSNLKAETRGLLEGFDKAHAEMTARIRKDLTQMKQELTGWNLDRKKESEEFLESLDKAHSEMAAQLRSDLEKAHEKLRKDTANLLQGFDASHSQMSTELRSQLADARRELAEEVSRKRAEAQSFLGELRKDAAETSAAWQDLVTRMRADRGRVVAVEPKAPAKPSKKAESKAASKAATIAEEEDTAAGDDHEHVDVDPEIVMETLREHPDGLKVAQIAEAVGGSRSKVGNVAKGLLDQGKVRKEGQVYFVS